MAYFSHNDTSIKAVFIFPHPLLVHFASNYWFLSLRNAGRFTTCLSIVADKGVKRELPHL